MCGKDWFYPFAFFAISVVFFVQPSVARATLYQPGETLEPNCAPTDTNCGVVSSLSSTLSSGKIYVGDGTDTGSAVTITGDASLSNSGVLTIGNDAITAAKIVDGTITNVKLANSTLGFTIGSSGSDASVSASTLALGDALIINIPDAGTGSRGVVTTGTQSFGGSKTFSDGVTFAGNLLTPKGTDYPTTGIQNDVDFGTGSLFRYTGISAATFTGFAGGADGRQMRIMNASASDITIAHQDTGSVAANRVITSSGSSVLVPAATTVVLQYDAGASRWRIVTVTLTASTISGFAFLQGGNAFGTAATLGTTDANALNLNTAGLTRLSLAADSATLTGTGATAITTNNSLALSSGGGSALNITASTTGALSLDSGTTGAISIGTGSNGKTITIGNITGTTALNLNAGTGGINLTGLVTLGNALGTSVSVLSSVSVGSTVTSTISGDNGVSTLRSDLAVTGSSTFQNVVAANVTTTGAMHATTITGDVQGGTLARIGSSTFSTLQDLQNVFHSAGWTSGGVITDIGGGAISVSAGTGLLRPSNSALSTVYYADWSASTSVAIPVSSSRFIGVEYNSGSPRVTSRTSADWNYKTDFPLGRVTRDDGTLHIASDVQGVGDHAANMIWREYETMPLARDERNGGLMLTDSGDNTRHLALSAGVLWDRLNRFSLVAQDTATGDTFDTYVGTTRQATAQSQWDNMNYNNSGVLTPVSAGQYAVLWVYVETDGNIVIVYGTSQHATLASATAENVPETLPDRLVATGKLVGRLIFQQAATNASETDSAFSMSPFAAEALTHLSNLTGLDFASSGLTGFVGANGVSGGQVIIGGTAATDGLTLQSTSGTGTSDFIKFLVGTNGGTEALRILDNGNVGIGTSSPSAKLSVNGETDASNFVATSTSATSTFAGPVTMANTLAVTGLSTVGALTATGLTTLQNMVGSGSTFTNATTTNLVVSSNSQLGTIISGIWNGTEIGPTFGGTGQTSWTTGDVLYADGSNSLTKLPIGSVGTVLTVGGGNVPTWALAGAGGGAGTGQWTTSTDNLIIYPDVPTRNVVIGASATTTLGESLNAIFEVTGNTVLHGSSNIVGLTTLSGGVASTNATLSGYLDVGGNATTTAGGAISANGLITAASAGTGLSVTNDALIGGLATIGNLILTGSSTFQNVNVVNSTTTNATTTNLYATNFYTDSFSPANLSTGGTLNVTGLTTLSNASTTGGLTVGTTLAVGGSVTTTGGVVNAQTGYQVAGVNVLTGTTLGAAIINSSLTTVGTLNALTVSGQTALGNASTTGSLAVAGSLFVAGSTTTTGGIVNTQTKYQIAGTDVLSGTTLGTNVVNSSLTSVGTLGQLTVSGQTLLGNVTTTGDVTVTGVLSVFGNATTSANGNIATAGTITSGMINGQTITSAADFTGSLTAAGLVTASNGLSLVSGTLTLPAASIADAALSSNVALLNRSGQTFTGTNTFSALTTLGSVSSTNLSVSGNFTASGNVAAPKGSDYVTTGVQNDVNLGTGSFFRYNGSGAATFTGLTGGTDGRVITIVNISAFSLTFTNQDAGSVAANEIMTPSGGSVIVGTSVSTDLRYDATVSRWRIITPAIATSASVSGFAFVQGGNGFGATATLGTTDANELNIVTGGATRFGVSASSATLTGTGATTITTDNSLTLSSAAGSALNVNSGTGGIALLTATTGNVSVKSGTTGSVTVDSGSTGAVNVGTGATAKTVTIGNTTGASTLNLQSGTGSIVLEASGTGTSGKVQVGTTTGKATPDQLVLDAGTSDPTGVNGGIYYSTTLNKFRCFQNSAWTNCVGGDKFWIPKSTDQAVTNSTVLTSDSVLTFPVGSGETWVFDFNLFVRNGSSGTPDFKAAILGASGWTCSAQMSGAEAVGAVFPQAVTTNCTNTPTAMVNSNISSDAGNGFNVHVMGTITTNSAGSVTLQFAENTAGAGTSVTVKGGSFVQAFKVGGADLAEVYHSRQSLTPGTVVSIDPSLTTGVMASTGTNDKVLFGVVTTKPGMVLGDSDSDAEGVPVLVALSGRIPVNVSTENGPIKAGDYLTSSSIVGAAMRATDRGFVIGQALSGYDGNGPGQVIMFVKNMYLSAEALDAGSQSLLGEVSPSDPANSAGLSTLVETIQAEGARDPVVIIGKKIADGTQFLTDFVAARVTAIRGYFDEIFTKKVHTEQLCVKKSDGTEVCVNGDQIQTLLNNDGSAPAAAQEPVPAPVSDPAPSSSDPVVAPAPAVPDSVPASDPAPAPEPDPAPAIDPTPVVAPAPAPDSAPVSVSESAPVSAPDPTPALDSAPVPDPAPAPAPAPDPAPAPAPAPAPDPAAAPAPAT